MKGRLFPPLAVGLTLAITSCTSPPETLPAPESAPQAAVESPAETADPSEEPDNAETEPRQAAQPDFQTYNETPAGIPVIAHYPADVMEVSGSGSGEGVGVFFTFQPQGTHLDEAEVHVFLPASTATAAELESFVTGENGLIESNGWIVDSTEAAGSEPFAYSWSETVIHFSTDREESGHIILGQTGEQAVQVTLFYPTEMSGDYWPAARTVLDSLEFEADLLPIGASVEQ